MYINTKEGKGVFMKNFSTYLLVMFMVAFWIIRVIVAVTDADGFDFVIVPMDRTIEIVLLFITLPCIMLVAKRKLLGTIIYLVSYLRIFWYAYI